MKSSKIFLLLGYISLVIVGLVACLGISFYFEHFTKKYVEQNIENTTQRIMDEKLFHWNNTMLELATTVISFPKLKKIKTTDKKTLISALNDVFDESLVTLQFITLKNAILIDKKFENIIAIASRGNNDFIKPPKSTLDTLKKRKGKARYQAVNFLWKNNEGMPVGTTMQTLHSLLYKQQAS